jgi:hypothetical protein
MSQMNHLTEEQLIAYRMGPAPAPGSADERARTALGAHLRECEACRAQDSAIERVLATVDAAPVPERDAVYGARVWQQIESRLDAPRGWDWSAWFAPRRWAVAAAVAAMIVAAFFGGHMLWPRHDAGVRVASAPSPQQAKERILLVAVGDHLDRTQMVLLEVVNADGAAGGGADISAEQGRAAELVESNRLYRQTAAHVGDAGVADLLDELEPILVQIAHSPGKVSQSELDALRQRIDHRGILFKVRVMNSEVRARERKVMQPQADGFATGKS